jgi:hypothetical protein
VTASGSYGEICGAWVDGRRCWARGRDAFGGRCRAHQGLDDSFTKRPQIIRCGHPDTYNGTPCNVPVKAVGKRCGIHTPALVSKSAERRQQEIEDMVARRRARLRARLGRCREAQIGIAAEIERLQGELDQLDRDHPLKPGPMGCCTAEAKHGGRCHATPVSGETLCPKHGGPVLEARSFWRCAAVVSSHGGLCRAKVREPGGKCRHHQDPRALDEAAQ